MKFLPGNPSWSDDGRCVIHVGDVFERLADIADESVDLTITSPPYWGLRDYGTAVWEGGDPACSHELTLGATEYREVSRAATDPRRRSDTRTTPARYRGGFCARCGAHRHDYQIGLEQNLGEHIEVICQVFDEVWRVTKDTGAVFLNYGDAYAAEANGRSAAETKAAGGDDRTFRDKPFNTAGPVYDPAHGARFDPKRQLIGRYQPQFGNPRGVFAGNEWNAAGYGTRRVDHGGRVVAGGIIKPKDLCLIPERLIVALQERGWWVRSRIVWGKPNAMPDSSGRGRPSNAHELIYLLTKSAEADVWVSRDTHELSMRPNLDERCDMPTTRKRDPETGQTTVKQGPRWIRLGSYWDAGAVLQPSSPSSHPRLAQDIDSQQGSTRAHAGLKTNGPMKAVQPAGKVAPRETGIRQNGNYNEAMKTRDRAPIDYAGRGRFLRNYEPAPIVPGAPTVVWDIATEAFKDAHFATFPTQLVAVAIAAACPPPNGVVLDPFGGSGTTALVALRMGRRAILVELDAECVATITKPRLELDAMGADERARTIARRNAEHEPPDPGPLFGGTLEAAE